MVMVMTWAGVLYKVVGELHVGEAKCTDQIGLQWEVGWSSGIVWACPVVLDSHLFNCHVLLLLLMQYAIFIGSGCLLAV